VALFVPHYALAKLLGQTELRSEATTVGALLEEIRPLVPPEEWRASLRAAILVNGRHIHHLQGMKTPLAADDEVWMVFPSAGG
jgi:molybdopterin converting factor small subunit